MAGNQTALPLNFTHPNRSLPGKPLLSPCHPDRRSYGPAGPPKVMKSGSCSATTVPGSAALPFVISTGAPKERSGEICGPAVLSWKCFSTERSRISYVALLATSLHAAHQRHETPQELFPTARTRKSQRREVFFLAAGFLPFFLVGGVELPKNGINLAPMGEPRPVQASHPGPAENAPLFPETISLNAVAAFAA
jgi:hypothetical protein